MKSAAERPDDNTAHETDTARDFAQGHEPDDLNRYPVADELAADENLPDPEDELLGREDTHYTEQEADE